MTNSRLTMDGTVCSGSRTGGTERAGVGLSRAEEVENGMTGSGGRSRLAATDRKR